MVTIDNREEDMGCLAQAHFKEFIDQKQHKSYQSQKWLVISPSIESNEIPNKKND